MKILSIVGARPNFMKVAPLHFAFQKYSSTIQHKIVHTGQHYDAAMSKIFFDDLELPEPDFYLGVGSDTHSRQTAKIMVEFEDVLLNEMPDLVIVVGDVNSTIACTLTSVKLGIPVAHVEAGLRSFDRSMPEEINRLLTDTIADYLFVTEPSGIQNLRNEGIADSKVFFVGNTMIDTLTRYDKKADESDVLQKLGLSEKGFILVTLHRPSNVDVKENLELIVEAFEGINDDYKIIFPIHPRTKKMLERFGLDGRVARITNLHLLEPVGYIDFLRLEKSSRAVVTDSGGIQEETTYLGVPCLTLRTTTERPITIEIGTNEICPMNSHKITNRVNEILNGITKQGEIPELWDGKASNRIAEIIYKKFVL